MLGDFLKEKAANLCSAFPFSLMSSLVVPDVYLCPHVLCAALSLSVCLHASVFCVSATYYFKALFLVCL